MVIGGLDMSVHFGTGAGRGQENQAGTLEGSDLYVSTGLHFVAAACLVRTRVDWAATR